MGKRVFFWGYSFLLVIFACGPLQAEPRCRQISETVYTQFDKTRPKLKKLKIPRDLTETLTAPVGEKFEITFTDSLGRSVTLPGAVQDEHERRLNIFGDQDIITYLDESDGVLSTRKTGIEYRNSSELIAKLIRWNSDGFSFRPLDSAERIYHGMWTYDATYMNADFQDGPFVEVVPGGVDWVDNRLELTQEVDFLVSSQKEISNYFDTQSRDLEKRGVTLRLKTWYPAKAASFTKEMAVARTVTLKIDRGAKGKFHDRQEWQVKVPVTLTDEDVLRIAEALRERVGVTNGEDLKVDEDIFNLRKGIMWQLDGKDIGFITVDNYRRLNEPETTARAQIELEIFPAVIPNLETESDRFARFFASLESFLNAEDASLIPKVKGLENAKRSQERIVLTNETVDRFFVVPNSLRVSGYELLFIAKNSTGKDVLISGELAHYFHEKSVLGNTLKFENGSIFIRKRNDSNWIEIAKETGRNLYGSKEFKLVKPAVLDLSELRKIDITSP